MEEKGTQLFVGPHNIATWSEDARMGMGSVIPLAAARGFWGHTEEVALRTC